MKTYLWAGLDAPRMEIAYVEDREHAHGTQLGLLYELRWELDGPMLGLRIVGGRREQFHLGTTDFFDVLDSPFFNSLPVLRDGLLQPGPVREYTMTYIEVPQLTATPVPQSYEPLGDRVVRYRAGAFQADIEYDHDGIVTRYPGYLQRLAPASAPGENEFGIHQA